MGGLLAEKTILFLSRRLFIQTKIYKIVINC